MESYCKPPQILWPTCLSSRTKSGRLNNAAQIQVFEATGFYTYEVALIWVDRTNQTALGLQPAALRSCLNRCASFWTNALFRRWLKNISPSKRRRADE